LAIAKTVSKTILPFPLDTYFPLTKNWDIQVLKLPEEPKVLTAKEALLIAEDKDLLSPKGWVYAAVLTANSPDAGILIRYLTPRSSRVQTWDLSIRDLYSQGLVNLASPGLWAVTRWGEAVAPEYAAILSPSFLVPYQPKGAFYVQNKGTASITVYFLNVTLIPLFEE